MNRQGFFSACGFVLLAVIVVAALHDRDGHREMINEALLTAPAVVASNVQATSFSLDTGNMEYRLQAEGLTQYDHVIRTDITKPHLTMRNKHGSWDITADHGEVLEDSDLIIFHGNTLAENTRQKTRLSTHALQFFTHEERLKAPHTTYIEHPSGHITTGRFEAELESGVLIFDQGVTSEYAVPAS